jgi:hypothetical protein
MFLNKLISKEFNWKTVEYVQSCVKDSVGVGKPLSYHFFAPIDQSSVQATQDEIDYKSVLEEVDELKLLQDGNYIDYMHK